MGAGYIDGLPVDVILTAVRHRLAICDLARAMNISQLVDGDRTIVCDVSPDCCKAATLVRYQLWRGFNGISCSLSLVSAPRHTLCDCIHLLYFVIVEESQAPKLLQECANGVDPACFPHLAGAQASRRTRENDSSPLSTRFLEEFSTTKTSTIQQKCLL